MGLPNSGAMLRAPMDTKQIQVMAAEICRWRWSDRSRGDKRFWKTGSIFRARADRVDRLCVAVVEDCSRKGPIHSSARIDVAAVVAHVRHRLLGIKIDRRRMTVDNVFRERSPVTKEAVADPKFRIGGLLVEGDAWTNPRVNIITEFVFVAGREGAHPFLRLPESGWRAQGGNGCSAAVSEKVREVPRNVSTILRQPAFEFKLGVSAFGMAG